MKIKISVTQEHIDQGVPGESWKCPITLALRGSGLTHASSGYLELHGFSGAPVTHPSEVRSFIRDFDKSEPVAPFNFELEIPDGN